MAAQLNENTQYIDPTTGELLSNGLVYIGENNLDAELNLITIYADVGLTTTLLNPQRIGSDGRVSNKIFIPGKYSLKVKDANNNQKLNDLSVGEAETISNTPLINIQGSNDIIADASPSIVSLVDGQTYIFTTVAANTGAMTLTIDSTPTYPIKKYHNIDFSSGDFDDHQILSVIFNDTDNVFELVGNMSKLSSIGIDDNATSTAMTIDSSEDISYVGTAQFAAGEGVVFNGDAITEANTLDDYEEGTWTPVLTDGSTNAAMNIQDGRYTKIGDLVTIQCRARTSSLLSVSGNLTMSGLPFTASSNSGAGISVVYAEGIAITAGHTVSGIISSADISLYLFDATTGSTRMQGTEWSADGELYFIGQYRV